MRDLDTLREQMEEAKANLPIALVDRQKTEGPFAAFLAAHRALVIGELASEPDAETRAKVVSYMVQYHGSHHTYADCVVDSVGPILRAPLAARLAQVEADR